MMVKVKKQQEISTNFTLMFLAGTAGAYQGGYQNTHSNSDKRRIEDGCPGLKDRNKPCKI
ncbi:MAG: hypothetical protein ACYSTT_06265 [Planctomycetota bacterium]|jgi:hypothetical protein